MLMVAPRSLDVDVEAAPDPLAPGDIFVDILSSSSVSSAMVLSMIEFWMLCSSGIVVAWKNVENEKIIKL